MAGLFHRSGINWRTTVCLFWRVIFPFSNNLENAELYYTLSLNVDYLDFTVSVNGISFFHFGTCENLHEEWEDT